MRARGFTLIEMMVAGTIAVVAITMVLGAFISQNKAFVSLDMTRDANGNGRDAALEMQASIKRAGFGIDPAVAFDFTCLSGSNCHDRVNAPDDITFYARNPEYSWTPQNSPLPSNPSQLCGSGAGCYSGNIWPPSTTTAPTSTTLTVTLNSGDVIHQGRILLVVCVNGAHPVFVTASSRTPASGTSPGGIATIHHTINSAGIFAETTFNACHSQSGAAVFLIDKFHYFVTTLSGEPWLVLDTGLDYNNNGTLPPTDVDDLIPVARDVEDMQVAYQIGQAVNPPFPTVSAPDTNHDWVVADDPGHQEEPSSAATPPQSGLSSGSLHPGNIRAVRVTLVLRSRYFDTSLAPDGGDAPFSAENRNDVSAIAVSQFKRFPQTFSVATRNMTVTNPYLLF